MRSFLLLSGLVFLINLSRIESFFVLLKVFNSENATIETHLLNITTNLTTIPFYCANCTNYFVVHGFQDSVQSQWPHQIADNLFFNSNQSNVFLVDWSDVSITSSVFGYETAVKNMNESIREFRYYWQPYLRNGYFYTQNKTVDIHCIGHSMGAHFCGLTGKFMKNEGYTMRRISAMDPAGPCFEKYSEANRLARDDAEFVDATHTSTSFGYRLAIGHADYYPNDGDTQPGCIILKKSVSSLITFFLCGKLIEYQVEVDIDDMNDTMTTDITRDDPVAFYSCSHSRAITYFRDSITELCKFKSYECSSWRNFKKNYCTYCNTNRMGFFAEKPEEPTYYFINVAAKKPHCLDPPPPEPEPEGIILGYGQSLRTKQKTEFNETYTIYCKNSAIKRPFDFNLALLFAAVFAYIFDLYIF